MKNSNLATYELKAVSAAIMAAVNADKKATETKAKIKRIAALSVQDMQQRAVFIEALDHAFLSFQTKTILGMKIGGVETLDQYIAHLDQLEKDGEKVTTKRNSIYSWACGTKTKAPFYMLVNRVLQDVTSPCEAGYQLSIDNKNAGKITIEERKAKAAKTSKDGEKSNDEKSEKALNEKASNASSVAKNIESLSSAELSMLASRIVNDKDGKLQSLLVEIEKLTESKAEKAEQQEIKKEHANKEALQIAKHNLKAKKDSMRAAKAALNRAIKVNNASKIADKQSLIANLTSEITAAEHNIEKLAA